MNILNLKGGEVNKIYSGVVITDTYNNIKKTLIQGSDYIVSKGSVKIAFDDEYLKNLSVGNHSLELSLTDTSDNTYVYPLTIKVNPQLYDYYTIPNTGV